MSDFTPFQKEAIFHSDGNCLVSAGAGSGKTAVLTERIYWLIVPPLDKEFAESFKASHNGKNWSPDDKEDPVFQEGAKPLCDPSELLVLTFGKGAAIEMKDRVRKKLSAHKETHRYLAAMEESDIANFDSFNLKMVNRYHFDLGLPASVSVVDEMFVKTLTRRILNEVLESRYENVIRGKDLVFAGILRNKCVKNDDYVVKGVLAILDLSSLSNDPDAFFDTYESIYLTEEFFSARFAEFEATVRNQIKETIAVMNHYYDERKTLEKDTNYLNGFLSGPDFDSMRAYYLANARWPNAPSEKAREGEPVPACRDDIKATIIPTLKMLKKSKEEYLSLARDNAIATKVFLSIAKEVRGRLLSWMKENLCYDFEGVANLMGKLLDITSIREEFKSRFRYIMVDEYQDTSNMQENFIRRIARDNVFCVGDIKQSIYRFRKANPRVFSEKLRDYGMGKGGKLITLPDNFRSREQVISSINRLFSDIMTESVGSVSYQHGHALRFGNHSYDLTASCEENGLKTLHYDADASIERSLQEARLIAKDIAKKLSDGFLVHSKDGARPCEPGDFAILVSRKKGFGNYVQAFREMGIPLSVKDKERIKYDDVVLVLRALLRLVDYFRHGGNESTLASSILTLARSFLFRTSDDVIYGNFKAKDYEAFPFLNDIRLMAASTREMTLKELILTLVRDFNMLEALLSLGDVEMNYQKIISLTSIAESMEGIGMGLTEFLRYLDDIDDFGLDIEVDSGNLEKTAVKLMSDHFSKGLQFKICYFPELSVNFRNFSSSFAATTEYGVVMSAFDENASSELDYISFLMRTRETNDDRSERMRLFYVALTRAEEMIILLTPNPTLDKDGNEKNIVPLRLEDCHSFYDFFLCSSASFPEVDVASLAGVSRYIPPKKAAEPEQNIHISFREIHHEGMLLSKSRASASLSEPIDPGILAFGNRLHRIMELTSFKERKLPPNLSEKEKEMFARVLALPLFDNASEAAEFHEYDFFDTKRNLKGSIDMFLAYEDHIDLIDFKTNTIDEDKYSDQLDAYAEYLQSAFEGKRIDKYLLSIRKGEIKRVD